MPRSPALGFILDLEMHGIKLGLKKIRALLAEMGDPQRRFPCVLVGGTNGKGSVTAMMSEALARAGRLCGRYTSPHLVKLEERICLNDRPIPAAALERGAVRVRAAVRRLVSSGRFKAPCTFFEATTALALDYFARSGVDAAILEVGLGGRFDATNAVEPVLSVITNIELDHERWLGSTRPAIAGEKVGIARAGRPLIVGPTVEESLRAIRAGAEKIGACFIEARRRVRAQRTAAGRDGTGPAPAGDDGPALQGPGEHVVLHGAQRRYGPLRLGLAGRHQIDNAVTAVAAVEELERCGLAVGAEGIEAGLARVRWPGRLEIFSGRPLIILDGAHNPAGARALASYLAEREIADLTLVFGAMRDKAIPGMARALFPLARRVLLTHVPYRRAAAPEEMFDLLAERHPRLSVAGKPGHALDTALALTSPGGAVCVCGSLYLVGSVLRHPAVRERRRAHPVRRAAALAAAP